MADIYNIYCDESCHLERDGIAAMVIGAIWCPVEKTKEISGRIRDIKLRHGLPGGVELKWVNLSPSKQQLYIDLIDFFFDDDDLHLRGIVIPDKSRLNHGAFRQTHDSWYYKMMFRMIEPVIDPTSSYRIYMDIKDTQSELRRAALENVLRSSRRDHSGRIIQRVQQIRSHESQLMQLTDVLIGAIAYCNRGLSSSAAKLEIIRRVRERSKLNLIDTTWLRNPKVSILRWKGRDLNDE